MRRILTAAACSLSLVGVAHATPVTITFDGLAAGTVVDTEIPGVTVSATGGSGQAIIFDSNNPTGEDEDLGAGFTLVGPNTGPAPAASLLIISEDGDLADPDDNGGGGIFTFDFDGVVNFIGFTGVDFNDASANLIVSLFDEGGAEVFSYDFNANSSLSVGDNEYYSFFTNVFGSGIMGVALATIELTGSGAIDNLTFDANAVPIPGAIPLLFSGIAGLGFAMRKKRAA